MHVFLFREDWKPVLTINAIIIGLQYLFLVSRFDLKPCLSVTLLDTFEPCRLSKTTDALIMSGIAIFSVFY